MGFRLISSGGDTVDPAFMNIAASGVINPNNPVVLVAAGTGGAMVEGGAGVDTTRTAIFGVCLDYVQGASDTNVRVIPFHPNQFWEVDCANAATTAQVGIRQHLSATRGYVHNQATNVDSLNRVFMPVAMTGLTTGSGKLIGYFLVDRTPGNA